MKLPLSLKFFFETDSIAFTSPATVSRCGILFISDKILTYKDKLNYKFELMIKNISNELKEYLIKNKDLLLYFFDEIEKEQDDLFLEG